MISGTLNRRANQLRELGEAFVIATVVRVGRPTSVEPGDVAIVNGDGTIEGFLGGVCAQHSVRLYSLKAIESGKPLLLRILPHGPGPDDGSGEEDPAQTEEISNEDGTVTVQNPCLSGGAIEAFLEPVLPEPRVLVAGDSPIVAALKRIGPELGLELVSLAARSGAAPVSGDLALVVAAHGRDELGILRAGLEAGLPYVGLVASRKRGAAVLEQLRETGVAEDLLERVETPAGLDIGARTAAEIAVSILARLVEVRRRVGVATPAQAAARPVTAVDPICGMTVVVGADTPSIESAGEMRYFCCLGCKLKFEEGEALRASLGDSLRESPGAVDGGEALRASLGDSLRESPGAG
jgi:xanthine dehydrogenase accessory factor